MFKYPGKPPTTLGLHDGKLAACPPGSGTCVCSQSQADVGRDLATQHQAALRYEGDSALAMARLLKVLERRKLRLVHHTARYAQAEYETSFWGMVSDLEFLLEPETQVIHVRSASRWQWVPDFGLNHHLLNEVRDLFEDPDQPL